MSRNRYEAAHGVARLRWHFGEPSRGGRPVLVEVWRAALDAGEYTRPERPSVRVRALVEVRFWSDAEEIWKTIGYNGETGPSKPGTVRRWADLPYRYWHGNLTIDGWTPERGES